MTDPTGRVSPTTAYVLGGLSALLLAFQLWIVAQWWAVIDEGSTQAELVARFHARLPFGMGALSTTSVTLLAAGAGAVGVAAALAAARGSSGALRALCRGLGAANALLVLWYLFTLM